MHMSLFQDSARFWYDHVELPCRIGSLSKHGRPCSDHGWNMVKERVLTMFQTSTLNGHHCLNMVETRSSDHGRNMFFWSRSDHVLTMVRIDYGQPWFDRGGHLTLMFKTWSNMVRYAIGFEFYHGLTMFGPWSTWPCFDHGRPCSIWHIVWSFLFININFNWIDK